MDRFFDWYWSRTRKHALLSFTLFGAVVINALLVAPVMLGAQLIFSLAWTDALRFGAGTASVVTIGIAGAVAHPVLRGLFRWGRQREGDPVDVWQAAIEGVWVASFRGLVLLAVLHSTVSVAVLHSVAKLEPVEYATAVVVAVGITGVGWLMLALGFQFLTRPVIDEVVHAVPTPGPPLRATPSIGQRIVAGFFGASFLAGIGSTALAARGTNRGSVFAGGVAAAVILGGYMAVVLRWAMLQPTLRPLALLTDATKRVRYGDYSTMVPITTGDELGDLTRGFNEMQRGLAERSALQAAFGSYVDPSLAARLLSTGSSMFEGEEIEATMLFADVRAFSSYAESVAAVEAVALLNRMFEAVVPAIEEHGGHTNHYLGDGLLAVFGAPSPLPNHADAAVRAAIGMQRAVRSEFGDTVRIGIGINTGQVIAGTVGGGGRYEFTVIGDAVNVASRVEQLTRETGDAILLTDSTYRCLSAPRPRTKRRGEFSVRGKVERVSLRAINP